MGASSSPLIGITSGTTSLEGQTPRLGTNQAYVNAIWEAGGLPILLVPGRTGRAPAVMDRLDGLLVPGGADIDPSIYGAARSAQVTYTDPARDSLEAEFIGEARRRRLPVFGICRGMQMINVVFGGTLYQDLPTERDGSLRHCTPSDMGRAHLEHDVQISPGSWFAAAAGASSLMVNSLHHQGVRDIGGGLLVTATSEDGVIEGLETEDRQTVSVQCHSEELLHLRWARGLFETFIATAAS